MVHLTSRANVQLRGLDPEADGAVARTLTASGLLPVPTHERVRNYLASPASGYFGGMFDVRAMLGELDAAVCSQPELAQLPGRFLFGLDDGRSDIVVSEPDVCWQALDSAGASGRLLTGNVDTGLRVSSTEAVAALVCCAAEFQRHRGECWRVRELPDGPALLRAAVLRELNTASWEGPQQPSGGDGVHSHREIPDPVGVFEQDNGRITVAVASAFGELSIDKVDALATESDELVVTPSRTVVVPGIARATVDDVVRRLSAAGFGVDSSESWLAVSSCVGSPRCAKAKANVRAHAAGVMPWISAGARMHFSGCERRCGRPAEPHTDVLATEHGYRVDEVLVSTESLLESLSVSRVECDKWEGP